MSTAPTASQQRDDAAEIAFALSLIQADLISASETVSRSSLEEWWGRRAPLPSAATTGPRATSIVDTWVANGWIEEIKPVSLSTSTPPTYSLRLSAHALGPLAARPPRRAGDNSGMSLPDDSTSMHAKARMGALFDATFPSLGPASKKSFTKLHDPTVILYATMGLQLVVSGAATVATFSRDMKSMGVDSQTRTIVTNYLAKSIPTTNLIHQPLPHHSLRPLA
ncbi:hypothetical protein H310_05629 [Aphanomyces invadans]|uniref:Uncharacterized protein n=1 Tax=Aphanomyces invadans TaxID=157072 RepID=A0A024UBF1_9STRA|nr:hypothetical protein H310_05629 [Aphanomyces invadans]ETW03227.1 hypothetical protein H310_05629 [Aphanomyces invadans]|eukprot:XP_008868611.1 hypothetical protein H310_05629 [Aphanomyces invadans]